MRWWMVAALALMASEAASAQQRAGKPTLVVLTISGLKDLQGRLDGGLYRTPASFPKDGAAAVPFSFPIRKLKCRTTSDDGATCTVTLPRVPAGRYAIAVAHDRNGDGEIERSPFSCERKGISNYTSKLLSMPSFDKAVTRVAAPTTRIAIALH